MALTIRCVLIFIAICSLIELIILCAMLNGYLQELEPLLTLVFDEEQMDALRTMRDLNTNGIDIEDLLTGEYSISDEKEQQQQQGGESLGFTKQQRQSSSSHSESADDEIHQAAYRAVNEKFSQAVLSLDFEETRNMLKYSSGVDVNYVGSNSGSLLFKLCSGKKENAEILKMVDLLLAQKDIDPNDDATSWPPLKGAIHARNNQCVVKLLRHKNTVPMVYAGGLGCDSVPHILSEVTVVVGKETPDCFYKHPNVAQMTDEKILEFKRLKEKRRNEIKLARGLNDQLRASDRFHQKGSEEQKKNSNNNNKKMRYKSDIDGTNTNKNTNQQQQQQQQKKKAVPNRKWEIVLDPTEFDSIFEASWFYFFGKEWDDCSDWFKVLIVIVGGHTIVVGGACYFYLSTLIENERIGIMPEVLTPPATPAMGPQQPEQQPPPAAVPEDRQQQQQQQEQPAENININNITLPAAVQPQPENQPQEKELEKEKESEKEKEKYEVKKDDEKELTMEDFDPVK